MAYTLIGGIAVGTVMIQVFLPALYVVWCRVRPVEADPFQTARLPEAAVA